MAQFSTGADSRYAPAFYVNLFDTKILAQAQLAGVAAIRQRLGAVTDDAL